MRTQHSQLNAPLALAVVVAILAPALTPLAVQVGDMDDGCEDRGASRCAGLWSSQCCDFLVPRSKDDGQRSTTTPVARLATDFSRTLDSCLAPPPFARARAPDETAAGQALPSHLSTTILLL